MKLARSIRGAAFVFLLAGLTAYSEAFALSPDSKIESSRNSSRYMTSTLPSAPLDNEITVNVFGSIAISVTNLPATSKWSRATAVDYSSFFSTECETAGFYGCGTAFGRTLRAIRHEGAALKGVPMLRFVNSAVNKGLPYQGDAQTWGQPDKWATIPELASKGVGDCEDFAIAKYWLLVSMGYPTENLQIVVLADTRLQQYHAVLVAHLHGIRYVLDNQSAGIKPDTSLKNYTPILSFNAGKSYIHGFANPNKNVALSLEAAIPGAGF